MIEPYNKLVKLAARAFYDDLTSKGDNQPKTGRSDNRGIAVVVLDALTRRQWVREEDLAKDLKLHTVRVRLGTCHARDHSVTLGTYSAPMYVYVLGSTLAKHVTTQLHLEPIQNSS